MATLFTYDTVNKLFILNAGTTGLNVRTNFYSEAKNDWRTDTTLNRLRFPILAIGGQAIGGNQTIAPYYQLRYGWKIRPQEASHLLELTNGNLITDDGTDPFVNTVGSYNVRIKYVVSANSLSDMDAAAVAAISSIAAESTQLRIQVTSIAAETSAASTAATMTRKFLTNRMEFTTAGNLVTYDDDSTSILYSQPVQDSSGQALQPAEGEAWRRYSS